MPNTSFEARANSRPRYTALFILRSARPSVVSASTQTLNLETMGAGTFALLTIAVLLLCSIVPIIVAYRSGTLTAADFALVLLPAPAFVFALLNFNEPARTGWAGILYPFLVLAVSVVALYARVFLLQRVVLPNRVLSIGTLIVVLMGAALLGAFVPPLYE